MLGYLLLLHVLMLWTLWHLDISKLITIIGCILLCVSLWYQLKRYQWLGGMSAVVEINYQMADHNTDAVWALEYADGQLLRPYQLLSSVVLADMVIIRFRKRFPTRWWARYETVLILANCVEQNAFRQLRVMLRSATTNDVE